MKRFIRHILHFIQLDSSSFIYSQHVDFKRFMLGYCLPLSIFFFSNSVCGQTAIINGPSAICRGDSATLTAASGYLTYRWSTGATTQSIKIGAGGTYSVTVTDAQSASFTDSKALNVNPLPVPNISGVPYVCNGRSTSLTANGNYRAVTWSTGERTNTIMVSSPTTYTLTVTDYNSCSGSSSITVRDGSRSYNALVDTVKICEGDSTVLDASTSFAISYYWNTDDTTSTLTVRDSGRYNVIISTGQCVNYDTVHVLILPPPIVNLGADTAICKGDTILLKAEKSPLYTYQWNNGSTASQLSVNTEGIYSVEVTFGNCRATDSIDVAIFDKIQGSVLDTVICTPQYTIDGQTRGAKYYKWNIGGTQPTITVSKTGNYNLLANNGKCFTNRNYNVHFKTIPVVNLGADTTICLEIDKKSLLLVAGVKGESEYMWQDNSTMNTFQAKESGTYFVKASNECGTGSGNIKVDMRNCFSVFVPTAFTPNEDGVNDDLQLFPSENVANFKQFIIFNRWGDVVFSANDFTPNETTKNAWDGRFNGKLVSPGVFVYYLEYETKNGNLLNKTGDITVVR